MSDQRNLSAFTVPQGQMPAYISVNFKPALAEGIKAAPYVTIDVRGHARQQVNGPHMVEGPTARIVMTVEEFRAFLGATAARALAEGLL